MVGAAVCLASLNVAIAVLVDGWKKVVIVGAWEMAVKTAIAVLGGGWDGEDGG